MRKLSLQRDLRNVHGLVGSILRREQMLVPGTMQAAGLSRACSHTSCDWSVDPKLHDDLVQGELRVALHMCLDALEGRPLPSSAPSTPVAPAPPPPITPADTDALMARFKVRNLATSACGFSSPTPVSSPRPRNLLAHPAAWSG